MPLLVSTQARESFIRLWSGYPFSAAGMAGVFKSVRRPIPRAVAEAWRGLEIDEDFLPRVFRDAGLVIDKDSPHNTPQFSAVDLFELLVESGAVIEMRTGGRRVKEA